MTGERTDLYTILGLPSQASQEEIRRAYRTLVRQHHPDTRPNSEPTDSASSDTTLQDAFTAYSVLGDPARRASYDHRTAPIEPAAAIGTRTAPRFEQVRPHQPPILAGPVHWHQGK